MANPGNLKGHGFQYHPERICRTGRPKGARDRKTIYREHLEKQGKYGLVVDDIVKAQISKALQGDNVAINSCFDSGYGKLTEKQENVTPEPKINMTDIIMQVLQPTPEQIAKITELRNAALKAEGYNS